MSERMGKVQRGRSYRATFSEQIAPADGRDCTNPTAVGSQTNTAHSSRRGCETVDWLYPGWSYGLSTETKHGEFVSESGIFDRHPTLLLSEQEPVLRHNSCGRWIPSQSVVRRGDR